jgi:FMN-dependent NADH-azoreductase
MNAREIQAQYRDPNQDKVQQRDINDSRKPVITLKALNKLKKMRAAKDLEQLMRGDFMEIMYGSAGGGEEGAAPGGGI